MTFFYVPESGDGLSVRMRPFPQPVVGGAKYNVTCTSSGVKPPPIITWHVNGRQITDNVRTVGDW